MGRTNDALEDVSEAAAKCRAFVARQIQMWLEPEEYGEPGKRERAQEIGSHEITAVACGKVDNIARKAVPYKAQLEVEWATQKLACEGPGSVLNVCYWVESCERSRGLCRRPMALCTPPAG